MTDANIQLEFRIITDETSDKTKTPEEFQDFLDEKITNLELASDSFIAYVIDNMNSKLCMMLSQTCLILF